MSVSIPPAPLGPVDVLVLATHPAQFGSLGRHLGPALAGTVGQVRVVCKTVGVGQTVAAAATTKRLVQLDPRAVVLLGTGRLYPERAGWQPGQVAVLNGAVLWSLAVSEGKAAFPDPMRQRAEVDGPLSRCLHELGGPGVGAATVASPDAPTKDQALALRIARETGADLEHPEAFSVLACCNLFQVPVAAVLGTEAAPSAPAADPSHARAAAAAASEHVAAWLHRGAPGIPHVGR